MPPESWFFPARLMDTHIWPWNSAEPSQQTITMQEPDQLPAAELQQYSTSLTRQKVKRWLMPSREEKPSHAMMWQ